MIHIREARSRDLPALGRLFDDYRQFYRLPEDVEKATGYITARLAAGDSVVLVAADEAEQLLGFAHSCIPPGARSSQAPCTCSTTSTCRPTRGGAALHARCSRRRRIARGAMGSCA